MKARDITVHIYEPLALAYVVFGELRDCDITRRPKIHVVYYQSIEEYERGIK